MKIAILGTGTVGKTLGDKLIACGHDVSMGSRTADNEAATAWAQAAGDRGQHGTFADAAAFGEVVINCTSGQHSVAAIEAAGPENLAGKVLLDLANPLDFSEGMPPTLSVTGRDSLAEQIQRAAPEARVVKTLNTLNCTLMVDPGRVPGDHDVFVCGNDDEARTLAAGWLTEWFGWKAPIDLGDLTGARGLESWLPLWVRLYSTFGDADFNLKIVRA